MRKEVLENHSIYLERLDLYKKFGYNIPEERNFILEKASPVEGKILEIGTGKGYFAMEIARQGLSFTSTDISETEQNIARLNLEYFGLERFATFQLQNGDSLSFQDRSFDVIFCINAFHHFFHPFQMIEEMIRIKSLTGKIVLSDFSEEGFLVIDNILASEGRKHEVVSNHFQDIEHYLLEKKFKIEKYNTKLQNTIIAR